MQPGYDSMTPGSNIPDEITTRSRQITPNAQKYYDAGPQNGYDPNYGSAPAYYNADPRA